MDDSRGCRSARALLPATALNGYDGMTVAIAPLSAVDGPVLAGLVETEPRGLAGLPIPPRPGWTAPWIAAACHARQAGRRHVVAIVVHDVGLVGTACLGAIGDGTADLSYWVASAHRGRGYATEGARRLICFGFQRLSLRAIDAEALADNRASQRVLAKLGFEAVVRPPSRGGRVRFCLSSRLGR